MVAPANVRLIGVDVSNPRLPDLVVAAMEPDLPAINPVKYGLSEGAAASTNRLALQAAIDEACGPLDPTSTVRTANRGVVIPAGRFVIDAPLKVRSVIGLQFEGVGFCEIRADSNMTSVLDINGAAYSRFGGFTITGSAGVEVDNAIHSYWDALESLRSNTRNSFHDVVIRNLNYVAGIRVGKLGAGNQVDNDEYRNISITGAWAAGETGRYQYGMYVGDGVVANNLVHHGYKLTLGHNRYNFRLDATQFAMYGGGFDGGEVDLNLTTTGYAHFSGIRGENSERLLTTTSTTAATHITLEDINWSADSMNADGNFITFNHGGVLILDNVRCRNPVVAPHVVVGSGVTPALCTFRGFSNGGTPGSYAPAAVFVLTASARAQGVGFVRVGASGATTSIEDYDSVP